MRTLLIAALLFTASSAEAQYRNRSAAGTLPKAAVSIPVATTLPRGLSIDCDLDRIRGREGAAINHSGSGWMIGGFASGLVLGLIGTAIITAVASSSDAEAERVPSDVEALCFRDGYRAKAKSMNTTSALTGGLLGTALLVVIVLSATSSSGY